MKGREGAISKAVTRSNSTTTDLLVCFPSHLTLLSKPISSPSPSTRSSITRSQPSPLFRTKPKPKSQPKPKPLGPCDFAEPTSPKVTCAGQIKINNRSLPCSKRPNWVETLRLKHDVMHFITCLRGLRFHMRCFGSFNHGSVDDHEEEDDDEGSSEDEINEEDEAVDEMRAGGSQSDSSKDIFSKWFMIIEEKQSTINGVHGMEDDEGGENVRGGRSTCDIETSIPPKNALLLMRCRSAPAKSWLEEREEEEEEEKKKNKKESEIVSEEERKEKEKEKKEKLILMRYGPDYWKISTDIAKETWVVGRSDPFSRSRSWRR